MHVYCGNSFHLRMNVDWPITVYQLHLVSCIVILVTRAIFHLYTTVLYVRAPRICSNSMRKRFQHGEIVSEYYDVIIIICCKFRKVHSKQINPNYLSLCLRILGQAVASHLTFSQHKTKGLFKQLRWMCK